MLFCSIQGNSTPSLEPVESTQKTHFLFFSLSLPLIKMLSRRLQITPTTVTFALLLKADEFEMLVTKKVVKI